MCASWNRERETEREQRCNGPLPLSVHCSRQHPRLALVAEAQGGEGRGGGIAAHNGSTKSAAAPVYPKENFSSDPSMSYAFGAK